MPKDRSPLTVQMRNKTVFFGYFGSILCNGEFSLISCFNCIYRIYTCCPDIPTFRSSIFYGWTLSNPGALETWNLVPTEENCNNLVSQSHLLISSVYERELSSFVSHQVIISVESKKIREAWNYAQIYLRHSDFSSLFRTLNINYFQNFKTWL